MKNLAEIEQLMRDLSDSRELAEALFSLRTAVDLHDARALALESEAAVERGTADVLRVALDVLEQSSGTTSRPEAQASASPLAFGRMPTRKCAEVVLRDMGRTMTATELADEITRRGKDLGKQASANVINALKRYADKQELFYRESTEKGFVYGLLEWKKEGNKSEGSAPGLEV